MSLLLELEADITDISILFKQYNFRTVSTIKNFSNFTKKKRIPLITFTEFFVVDNFFVRSGNGSWKINLCNLNHYYLYLTLYIVSWPGNQLSWSVAYKNRSCKWVPENTGRYFIMKYQPKLSPMTLIYQIIFPKPSLWEETKSHYQSINLFK